MSEPVMVFVSCESREQADRIAEALVEERLAACVNTVPGVRSCYAWEGKLTWSDEVLCVIKTQRHLFDQLRSRVRELHSYEVPEVLEIGIVEGDADYLRWVGRNLKTE